VRSDWEDEYRGPIVGDPESGDGVREDKDDEDEDEVVAGDPSRGEA